MLTEYEKHCAMPCCLSCSTIFERASIVVCFSPLVSLMMDQVYKYSSKGLATQFVGEALED